MQVISMKVSFEESYIFSSLIQKLNANYTQQETLGMQFIPQRKIQ